MTVFSTDKGDTTVFQTKYPNSSISNIDFNSEGIIKLLYRLNPNKASEQGKIT